MQCAAGCGLAGAALIALTHSSTAQTGPMPATTVTADAYVQNLGGDRIRLLYHDVNDAFLFELQDRDVANLFSYGLPPQDRGLPDSDMVVTFHNTWEAARAFYQQAGLNSIAERLPVSSVESPGAYVNMTTLTLGGSQDIRFYTFVRFVEGRLQDERCMARLVIDDTYAGAENGRFNSATCSEVMD